MKIYAYFIFTTMCVLAFLQSQNKERGIQYQPAYYSKVSKDERVDAAFLQEHFKKATAREMTVCYHEAGHFVANAILGLDVLEANVIGDGGNGGFIQGGDGYYRLTHSDDDKFIKAAGVSSEFIFLSANYKEILKTHFLDKGSDLYQFKDKPKEVLELIEKSMKRLALYKRHIRYVAQYLYYYKELDEDECEELIEILVENKF